MDPDRLLIDVDVFEKTILTALAAAEADMGDPDDQLGQALALYRDDFLCDLPHAEWAFPEREYLRGPAAAWLSRTAASTTRRRTSSGSPGSNRSTPTCSKS